jgi:hypothetical protein
VRERAVVRHGRVLPCFEGTEGRGHEEGIA